mgnify:CR=1 FL=1
MNVEEPRTYAIGSVSISQHDSDSFKIKLKKVIRNGKG